MNAHPAEAPAGDHFRVRTPVGEELRGALTALALVKNKNIRLQDQVDTLEETVRQLRAIMRPNTAFISDWRLSKQQTSLLAFVYGRQVATNLQCIEALGRSDFHEQLGPDKLNHLKVVMHNLRRKLEPFDITIHTVHRQGYAIDSENKARVRAGIISAGLVEN